MKCLNFSQLCQNPGRRAQSGLGKQGRQNVKTRGCKRWKFCNLLREKQYNATICWRRCLHLLKNEHYSQLPTGIYSWLPITRTLDSSNLQLTWVVFFSPSDHFYVILPSITRTMFWALKRSVKIVYWRPKHRILNFSLMCLWGCVRATRSLHDEVCILAFILLWLLLTILIFLLL